MHKADQRRHFDQRADHGGKRHSHGDGLHHVHLQPSS
jgi:hypothetical protein